MNTSLLAQTESGAPVVLCEISQRMASKHAAACEKARKTYLRAVYGDQPPKGEYWGWIRSAIADGSIVTVEVNLVLRRGTGLFELPLHVFQKESMPFKATAAIQDLSGYVVKLTVMGQYSFNGITLSNVTSVELKNKSNVIYFGSE